ncbi:hypothetical protein [Denitromonas sp.]|uniref:hypothetical protein n=1 Tax=Denitromonas sp. TaxID=2734609 RepID=UPI002AFDFB44|nr:hypothetical protein [Denitromonas sp.]
MLELSLTPNQQNWLTTFALVVALLQWFGFSPLPWLRVLLRHLGRPGRHLDRLWRHRLIRRAKRVKRDPRLYNAGLWKRLFFIVLVAGIGLMFHGALASQAPTTATSVLSFFVGSILYLGGLEAVSWATTYLAPQPFISRLRPRLLEAQRQRNAEQR